MASIFDTLTRQLGGGALQQISRELGTDEARTGTAVATALPMLLSALSRNASSSEGAAALHGALNRDHDGSVLDDLPQQLGRAQGSVGDGILGHVLGSQRPAVEAGLSRTTGMDGAAVTKMLTMLAPVVMGALGRVQRSDKLDAKGLAGLLNDEEVSVQRRQPEASSLIGKLLDADGDGDFDIGDVAKRGLGFLGNVFRR